MSDRLQPVSDELKLRLISGTALAAIGIVALVLGGVVFAGLCAVAIGLMIWELSRLLWPGAPRVQMALNGLLAAAALLTMTLPATGNSLNALILALVAAVIAVPMQRGRLLMAVYAPVIMLAGSILANVRLQHGMADAAWLVLLVAATDMVAYAVGKSIGGPRLAPAVSPGKRWSGAVGGCVAAGVVTVLYFGMISVMVILIGLVLSIAAQFGDLAESWVKRRAGVKDSSNLIPGHGGVMDRFDGMAGACVLYGLLDLAGLAGAALS